MLVHYSETLRRLASRRIWQRFGLFVCSMLVISGCLNVGIAVFKAGQAKNILSRDLNQDYLLGRAILGGLSPYDYSVPQLSEYFFGVSEESINPHPSPHPPTFAATVGVLMTLFTPRMLHMLWVLLSATCLVLSVELLFKEFHDFTEYRTRLLVTFALLLSSPVNLDLFYGQHNLVMLLLLTYHIIYLKRDREQVSGIFLASALAVKQIFFPILFILCVRGRIRVVMSTVVAYVLISVLSVFVVGVGQCLRYWLDVVPTVLDFWLSFFANFSIQSIPYKFLTPWGIDALTGSPVTPHHFGLSSATLLLSIPNFLYVVIFFSYLLYVQRKLRIEESAALLLAACPILSPICWQHYFIFVLPAAIMVKTYYKDSVLTLLMVGMTTLLFSLDFGRVVLFFAGSIGDTGERVTTLPISATLLSIVPSIGYLLLILLIGVLVRERYETNPKS